MDPAMLTTLHPFQQFILKIHSRCDLRCDYCFVYTKVDQRWSERPMFMTPPIMEAAAERIAEHARTHRLDLAGVVLHGGEPMLAGMTRIAHCVRAVRAAVDPAVALRFAIQTNGMRLTTDAIGALRELGVHIGVSLDGDAAAHDRHRRRRDGRGSHAAVAAALRELRKEENADCYGGVLCTVDLENDPVTTYEALLEHEPPLVDFLLPVANWDDPPPGGQSSGTPYADWLIAVFDRWYGAPRRETHIRWFEEIINTLFGGPSMIMGAGLSPSGAVVVEVDGAIEVSDDLTSTYTGAATTSLNVLTDPFDAALTTPLVVERQSGLRALATTCRQCALVTACGGGDHAHRFSRVGGFRNPSVYCGDLFAFIDHIRDRLAADLSSLRVRLVAADGGLSPQC
jgi:uncharacterized protein